MTAGVSPTSGDIFIVGPVRSGTSWLHTLLAEHPTLVSPPETHMFANYLGPLVEAWQKDRALLDDALSHEGQRVALGLATVLSDDEFDSALRTFYSHVRELVVAEKAGATRFLEKTPDHSHWLDTIWRIVPDASIVFMVRDPRDTVRSVLNARGETWGAWAPESLADATSLWLTSVRPYFSRKRHPQLMLVRYEDLQNDRAELDRVAKFLGLGRTSTWLATNVDDAPQARASLVLRGRAATKLSNPYDTEGFSYHERARDRPLTAYEGAYVVDRCRNEMEALGYSTAIEPVPIRLRAERLQTAIAFKARSFVGSVRRRTSGGRS